MKSQMVVSRRCPICDSARFARLRFCKNPNDPFWRKCKNCKSIYARDIPDSRTIAEHYEGYYDGINLEIPQFVRSNLDKRIGWLNGYRTESNNILDIGFGAGIFLEAAQDQGWLCSGTEYSPDSIRIATSNGWTVHKGDLSEGDLPGPFDVVAAIEVLEHVSNPASIVRIAARRLRKGGAFYGTTPNSQSINAKVLGENWSVLSYPEHQVLLCRKSLKHLSKAAFLEGGKIWTSGLNPRDLTIHISSIFSKEDKGSLSVSASRNEIGYKINGQMSRNRITRIIKQILNATLSMFNVGDSLNFLLEKNCNE
jgi:2-polyprenyl-3-methyl-5-hydroxy-6-metoxy-1,4-benzoquinol methylase